MKKSGARAIAEALEQEGVDTIFGLPGSHDLPLFDALLDTNIRVILTASELGASFMGDAYSRVTGKVGVCIVTSGPGLTYMGTGLAEAYLDSSPLIALVTGVKEVMTSPVVMTTPDEANKAFKLHEIDQGELAKSITKKFVKISKLEELPNKISHAFYCARAGEPGSVVVEIPAHILGEAGNILSYNRIEPTTPIITNTHREKIESICRLLQGSKFLGIYAGLGAFGASQELLELSAKFFAPIATTISGKGVIPEDYKLSVGFGFGPCSSEIAEKIFKKCDTLIAIGCKFGEMATCRYHIQVPENLIHIDINPEVLDRNYKSKVSLCMDVKSAMKEILSSLSLPKFIGGETEIKNKLITEINQWKQEYFSKMEGRDTKEWVHPGKFFLELRKLLPRNAILVTDCGNHQLWAIADFQVFEPRTFISPTDFQAMGFGIPAAIASKIAYPERQVVCVCGDGGFRMSSSELLTAMHWKVSPVICVFNDGALGLIKDLQQRIYGRIGAVNFVNPDFRQLARSYGAEYIQIKNDADLNPAMTKALSSKVLCIVDVNVKYSELSPYVKGCIKAEFQTLPLLQKLKLISQVTYNHIKNY